MNKVTAFVQKERLYVLILIFVILFNVIMMTHPEPKAKGKKAKAAAASFEEEKAKKLQMEEKLRENAHLAVLFSLASLLILAIVFLGIVIDIALGPIILKKGLDIRTLGPPLVKWGIWDVAKVVILFLFFGYMIVLTEAFLSRVVPILKTDNFRMIINSSILDILMVVLIIYFAVIQYKEEIKSLGVSFKNFLKNVFYGVVGYISLVPILMLILIITAIIINITKYVPAKQPVVELFLKETHTGFLAYSSLFAAIVGPMIEELFFRGFMYAAFKKYIGVWAAMAVTAAIFAALHTHPVGFLPIMALGMLLAYLYEKTGTLVSSITVHIIHNLSMVFLVFLIKQVGMG